MKKLTAYVFALALLVFAMSGCGGGSGGDVRTNSNTPSTQSTQSKRMVFTSAALKRDGKYSLYRGDQVGTIEGITSKYYLAPITRGNENITMNLEFSNAVSQDLPFMITDSDDATVLFYYNPKGTGTDTTTASVTRFGGATQKLQYTNLTLTNSSIELDDSDVIDVVLNSDGTATAGGTTIPSYNYVWHADPQHPAEYWTLGTDGTTELDEDAYEDAITSTNNGMYIAHDIRYTPNTLNFTTSSTAKKDEDTEYVVYYDATSSAVAAAIKELGETYGSAYSTDKYIFATLPMSNGMGGGNPPDGNGGGMGGPGSGDRSGNTPGTPPSGGIRPSADSDIAAMSTMTHSASDAYNNPVLHITSAGTYRLSGTWKGQIWIETGAKVQHQVALILNGVDVECTVAPALVFYKVYKWAEDNGYDDQSTLSANNLWRNLDEKMISSDGFYDVGAIVEVADGSTNTFTGANTYRILELSPKIDDDTEKPKYEASEIGSNISAQQKLYKLDGAFHSRRTMVIGGGTAGTGKLNITSTTCEGLDSEMHMVIDGGVITVSAPDDGLNVNEDNVSCFIMNSGTLTVSSTQADGIDSNGWIAINGGTLNITAGSQAQNSAGEAGLDAENGTYVSDSATYNWTATSGNNGTNNNTNNNTNDNTTNNDTTNNNNNTNNNNTNVYVDIPVSQTTETIDATTTFTLFPENATVQTDTEGTRNIPSTGNSFPLVHRVNDFAGIR